MSCKTRIIQLTTGGAGGNTIYAANDTLTGNRIVNMGGFDLTFNNGGTFVIDGKLTVTGLIDPIGLIFTATPPAAVPVTVGQGALLVGDGTGGTLADELYFKTSAGVSDLVLRKNSSSIMVGATAVLNGEIGAVPQPLAGEEGLFLRGDGTWAAGGSDGNFAETDLTATANRSHDWATFNYTQSNFSTYQLQSVGNAFFTINSNITLDASTITLTSPTGQYVLGDGTVGTNPPLDSDTTGDVLTMLSPVGNVGRVSLVALRTLSGIGVPVDGTTTAYYVGQHYVNQTTNESWFATAKSTDPDASPLGSTWVKGSGDNLGNHTATTTLDMNSQSIVNVGTEIRNGPTSGTPLTITTLTNVTNGFSDNLFINTGDGGGSTGGGSGNITVQPGGFFNNGTGLQGGSVLVRGGDNNHFAATGDGGDVTLEVGQVTSGGTGNVGQINLRTPNVVQATATNGDILQLVDAVTGEVEFVTLPAGASPYEQTFDATTDWGVASGGFYEITVAQGVHGKTTISSVQIWQGTTDFDIVMTDRVRVNAAGDVLFRVAETPDNRFAGKVVIA